MVAARRLVEPEVEILLMFLSVLQFGAACQVVAASAWKMVVEIVLFLVLPVLLVLASLVLLDHVQDWCTRAHLGSCCHHSSSLLEFLLHTP